MTRVKGRLHQLSSSGTNYHHYTVPGGGSQVYVFIGGRTAHVSRRTSSQGMDVDVAFLNAALKEDVYIEAPAGYKSIPKGMVLKLNKALYGLKRVTKGMEYGFGTISAGRTQNDET